MNFSLKFENIKDKVSRKIQSDADSIDDMKVKYEESIESLEEIIDKLLYFKRKPEKLYNDRTNEFSLFSINKKVNKSPKTVKIVYGEFRDLYPLLPDKDISRLKFKDSTLYKNYEPRETFLDNVKKHISFLKEIKKIYRRALDNVEESQMKKERQDYNKKAFEQRDKKYDSDDVIPEMTPENTRDEIIDKFEDIKEKKQKENRNQDDDDNDDMNLMTRKQFIHYIILYLKNPNEPGEYYEKLRLGNPKQGRIIEENIYGINSLRNLDYNKDGLFRLNDREIKFIENQVNNEKIDMTLDKFEAEYEKNL